MFGALSELANGSACVHMCVCVLVFVFVCVCRRPHPHIDVYIYYYVHAIPNISYSIYYIKYTQFIFIFPPSPALLRRLESTAAASLFIVMRGETYLPALIVNAFFNYFLYFLFFLQHRRRHSFLAIYSLSPFYALVVEYFLLFASYCLLNCCFFSFLTHHQVVSLFIVSDCIGVVLESE